ncbi:MAG: alpha/beta hydrolase [Rhodospirillales bacterium]|nr:alpha/beta hydrolase [Rhodospirillales bacterium]
MFPGFAQHKHKTTSAEINFRRGGGGPPLLLIHGYPQTHVMWHRIAPDLARRFTVIVPDLRGYGDSAKPPSDPQHLAYSKRTMAQDLVELMAALGWPRFSVVGHDRGGRVAYRMALDHPKAVAKLAVLDIVPTHAMWTNMNMALGMAAYHWLFLAQPAGLPETMIGHDPIYYLEQTLNRWSKTAGAFTPEAMAEYRRCFAEPDSIRATCEDYRAGASVDFEHDAQDYGQRKIACPVLAIWGDRGLAKRRDDPLVVWREWAADVRGHGVDCGHFLAEEAPAETHAALEAFL